MGKREGFAIGDAVVVVQPGVPEFGKVFTIETEPFVWASGATIKIGTPFGYSDCTMREISEYDGKLCQIVGFRHEPGDWSKVGAIALPCAWLRKLDDDPDEEDAEHIDLGGKFTVTYYPDRTENIT